MISIDIIILIHHKNLFNLRYQITKKLFKYLVYLSKKLLNKGIKLSFTVVGEKSVKNLNLFNIFNNDNDNIFIEFDQSEYDMNILDMLGIKLFNGYLVSKKKNKDIIGWLGSNDFISENFFIQVKEKLNKNKNQMFGINRPINNNYNNSLLINLNDIIIKPYNLNYVLNLEYIKSNKVLKSYSYGGGIILFNKNLYSNNNFENIIKNSRGNEMLIENLLKKLGIVYFENVNDVLFLNIKTDNDITGWAPIVDMTTNFEININNFSELVNYDNKSSFKFNSNSLIEFINLYNSFDIILEEIKFLDLSSEIKDIRNEINYSITNIVNQNNFILGKEVDYFEYNFSKYIGTNYCVGVANGTDALEIAVNVLNLDKDSEIITQSNTYVATCFGITNNNVNLKLVDVDKDTLQMDLDLLEKKITSKTKAIIIVHLTGSCCNMDKLMNIVNKYNLILIEDCAQSHGARFNNRTLGTYGLISTFSFYPGKNLGAFGDGGAICTNDVHIYNKIKMIRNNGSIIKYNHKIFGRNSRLDTIHASILNVKLKYLNHNNLKRNTNAKIYKVMIDKINENHNLKGNISYMKLNEGCSAVYHLFIVKVKNRDKLRKFLSDYGVQTGVHYPIPIFKLECYKNYFANKYIKKGGNKYYCNLLNIRSVRFYRIKNQLLNHIDNENNVALKLSQEILSLPMYPNLMKEKIERVCNLIKLFYIKEKYFPDLKNAEFLYNKKEKYYFYKYMYKSENRYYSNFSKFNTAKFTKAMKYFKDNYFKEIEEKLKVNIKILSFEELIPYNNISKKYVSLIDGFTAKLRNKNLAIKHYNSIELDKKIKIELI